MKKYMIVVLAGAVLSGSAFGAIPCAKEIQAKAQDQAASDGYENCVVGDPTLSAAVELKFEYGSIGLRCQHHVSKVSVVTSEISYLFSRPASANCDDATITGTLDE